MTTRRVRRNPPLPSAPAKRRFAGAPVTTPQERSALARVRRMASSVNERDRPFNPERPGSWRGSSRDLVVNGRMDDFTRGFLETALWSSTDNSDDSGGEPLDKNYSIDDFTPHALKELIADCEQFQRENAADLAVAYEQGIRGSEGDDEFSAGHDFWLTRCGHGTGFWDGDYPEPQATRLTKSAEKFGNVDLTVEDGVIHADGHWNTGRLKRNGEQQNFPWGSKRAGALEVTIPTFDWKQISGDMNPGSHGAIIARADGSSIELVEIQPVREHVGDGEAAEVGFPFWTREAYYDADDLSPSNKDVQDAIRSVDLDLDEVKPEHLAEAIAEALMRYGTGVDEAEGGWATDIVQFPVMWWSSKTPQTFEEFCGDEDAEFRREVLGESYTYKMTYETWNEEALEAGETDDKGWVEEGSADEGLDDLLNNSDIKDHNWVEWSDSNPDGKRSWLIAEEEEDHRTGERTVYHLWIDRADGKPKSQEEIDAINEKLGISNFGRMRRNRK